MRKTLPMSIVVAMIAIPMLAAREKNPVRAVKKALLYAFGFAIFYLLAIRFIYPRLPS